MFLRIFIIIYCWFTKCIRFKWPNYVIRMRRLPLIVGNDLQVRRTWRGIFNKFGRDVLFFFFFLFSFNFFHLFFFVLLCKIKSLWFVSLKDCQVIILFGECWIFKDGHNSTIRVSDLLACIRKASDDYSVLYFMALEIVSSSRLL